MFCCFGVTSRLTVINKIHCSSSVSRDQQTPPITSDECHQLATVRRHCVLFITTDSSIVDNTRWRQILVENSDFSYLTCTRNVAITFGTEKQNGFDTIHERDRHTNGRTDGRTDTAWRHRPRLCIASRGKN